jgi:hypothetical protein
MGLGVRLYLYSGNLPLLRVTLRKILKGLPRSGAADHEQLIASRESGRPAPATPLLLLSNGGAVW